MKKTPLKRLTPLKSKTPLKTYRVLRKVSKKQAKENALWSKIKQQRIDAIVDKVGYLKCEWCGHTLLLTKPDAHHLNGRGKNLNTVNNCRIVHRWCHTYITDNNVKDVPSLL